MDPEVERLHEQAPLTDVHAHPSLKAFLFRRNLWRHYKSGAAFNPFSSRSDFRMLRKGRVGVLWAGHYLPERQLFKDCFLLRLAAFLLTPAYWKLTRGPVFDRLLQMMDALEREIHRDPTQIELARSVHDIDRIRREGKIAVVHTVEGAHVLEGEPDRLRALAKRGVAMLTLNHFYRNGVGSQVDAMPKDMCIRKLCSFEFRVDEPPHLTDFGREVLRVLSQVRIIPDVTHCTPDARAEILAEIDRRQPIVASHVGVKALNPDPYNLGEDEIREIAASGGVVGVILMPYWLARDGARRDVGVERSGVDQVVDTMEHIERITGSWDHVVIGTDFDGFTEPPEDLKDASRLGLITRTLLDRGVPEDDIKKVLGGNARRVLETGWV
jgi:membrane dipeptidase